MHDLISDLVAFLQVLVTMIWNMEKTQLDVDSRIVLLSDIKTPASCEKVWKNLKKEPEEKKKKKGGHEDEDGSVGDWRTSMSESKYSALSIGLYYLVGNGVV